MAKSSLMNVLQMTGKVSECNKDQYENIAMKSLMTPSKSQITLNNAFL